MRKCTIVSTMLVLAGFSQAAEPLVVDMTKSPKAVMRPIGLTDVSWTDGFWADRYIQTSTVTLHKLWDLAADPDEGHVLDNFRAAAAGNKEGHAGTTWQDAWLYKWIESAASVYAKNKDPWIAERMDEAIALIAAAQEEDGYIATQTTASKRERFTDEQNHEVYTMGHLLTAACIHQRVTGKDSLMNVAIRNADFLCETLGKTVDPGYAHNPSAIMGLVEMYRQTGEKRYLDCAKLIVDKRGHNPKKGGVYGRGTGRLGSDQIQDRIPLREAKEVVGHNVFFTYLFSGATDVYMETGDKTILDSLDRMWHDLTGRKMCINGGVSPMGRGLSIHGDPVIEAVGAAYNLPAADSYNETCGQVGNFMWNYRMLTVSGDAKYADIMEKELYNGFLAGIGLDGESWFYRNSLRLQDDYAELVGGHNFLPERVVPGRKRICCPTNLLRTLAQLQTYFYSIDDKGLWVHQFGGNSFNGHLDDGRTITLSQKTDYPWDGTVVLNLDAVKSNNPFSVRVRIPGWAQGATVTVNGKPVDTPTAGTYLALERNWNVGDRIELNLPMEVRLMNAHPKVEQLRNQVAVMRGPLLYCVESCDMPEGKALDRILMPTDIALSAVKASDLPFGIYALEGNGLYDADVPSWEGSLYQPMSAPVMEEFPLRMVPYFAWANRGGGGMDAWLQVHRR